MTKTLLFGSSLALLLATAASAQDRPAGAEGSGCDLSQFTPVLTSRGEVAYWMNPTCAGPLAGEGEVPERLRGRYRDNETAVLNRYLE